MIVTAMKKRLFFCFLILSLGMFSAVAQTPTTQGKEFWASFMRNGYNSNGAYDRYTLIASAKHACRVTVTNPYTNWSTEFNVPENGVSTCVVDRAQGYNDQMGGTAYKGLLVTSTDTISLYIANEAENSYDAANVLPSSTLGSHYMIQSYKAMGDQTSHYGESRSSFLVLATEPETEVQIVPSCLTYDNHAAGQAYTVTLGRGECYHVLNKNAGSSMSVDGDFSGTTVVSANDKPIAVFNGDCITSVPGGLSTGYDHIFEQAMPTDYWGQRFVVTSTRCPQYMNLQPDQIKVTALNDNTTVRRDGEVLFTLRAGQSDSFQMDLVDNPCTYLEADNPIAVYSYQHSHGSTQPNYGDPSMVWISPVEQTVFEVTFSTFEVQEVEVHFVNIVCYSQNVAQMTLDGEDIASEFSTVPGAPTFSYARIQVDHAAHTLRCPGGFIAHVYGIGQAEGYAYSVGSSAKTLTKQLYVNDMLSTELPSDFSICQNDSVQFRVETNYDIHHVEWDFGDYSGASGVEVTHTYHSAGWYGATSVIYREMNTGVQPFDTLTAVIPVYPIMYGYVNLVSCDATPGVFYDTLQTSHGCDSIVITTVVPGDMNTEELWPVSCEEYVFRDSVFTTSGYHEYLVEMEVGCDSLYMIYLTLAYPPQNPERYEASCDTFQWHGIKCYETRDYFKTYTTAEGCVYDSVLHYTHIPADDVFDTIVTCDSYFWENALLTLTQPGDYDTTLTSANGCETNYYLHLSLSYKPPFNEIKGLSYVAVATNFWPGEYVYYLDDTVGFDTQRIEWELSDNENGEWGFRPHGASCTIVTYTKSTKELTARASGGGDCEKTASITINSTGYAVDETETVSLVVYPNPAKDEVVVEGNELKNIILYNLLGQKVKEVYVDGETSVRIEVGDLPKGLYLVNVITRHGNKTQLVSVIK